MFTTNISLENLLKLLTRSIPIAQNNAPAILYFPPTGTVGSAYHTAQNFLKPLVQ